MSAPTPHLARLGAAERLRLWLSYQRYALLLIGLGVGLVAGLLVWQPRAWYLWGPAALLVARPVAFGFEVWGRYPKKIRATLVALRRIETRRFHAESVRRYCGDPCFRVVAREILRRAGVPADERRALVRRFQAEVKAADRVLVLVDRTNGVVVKVQAGGDGVRIVREERTVEAGPC